MMNFNGPPQINNKKQEHQARVDAIKPIEVIGGKKMKI